MRYLVFAGEAFYPLGGWDDFVGAYASLEEAAHDAEQRGKGRHDWAHVVDLETRQIITDDSGRAR